MQYHHTTALAGNPAAAIDIARQRFNDDAFQITHDSDTALEVTVPKRAKAAHDILLGIKQARFTIEQNSLVVDAEIVGLPRGIRRLIGASIYVGVIAVLIVIVLLCLKKVPLYLPIILTVMAIIDMLFPIVIFRIAKMKVKEHLNALVNQMAQAQ